MACSCQPKRTKVYDEDLRWRMVYQKFVIELSYREIAMNLEVDASTAVAAEHDRDWGG